MIVVDKTGNARIDDALQTIRALIAAHEANTAHLYNLIQTLTPGGVSEHMQDLDAFAKHGDFCFVVDEAYYGYAIYIADDPGPTPTDVPYAYVARPRTGCHTVSGANDIAIMHLPRDRVKRPNRTHKEQCNFDIPVMMFRR